MMAQSVKRLSHKLAGLSPSPQQASENLDMATCACDSKYIRGRDSGIPRSQWPAWPGCMSELQVQ